MQRVSTQPAPTIFRWSKTWMGAALLGALVILGLAWQGLAGIRLPSAGAVQGISRQTLEQTYGLKVNLLAVTAAGGMVDVRMSILDPQKAKVLLGNKASFPALQVEGSQTLLLPPEDSIALGQNLKKDGILMLLYPNVGSQVKQGSSLSLVFGNLRLEALPVQ